MKILFMGTPDFAVPSLRALAQTSHEVVLVVTQPDRPKGRSRVLTPPPVKVAAQALGIPVFQPEKIRSEEALARLESMQPDLLVTAAYGQILPQRLLDLPPYGCVNVHASLLPRWRGGAPIHRAIMAGDKETGVTLMRMVQDLDAGAILAQVAVPITEEDTVGTLHDKLAQAGADLLVRTLPQIFAGTVREVPQDDRLATYAPTLKREDERIDWQRSARQIVNQVRGLNPWPVAYTIYEGQIMKVWQAQVLREEGQEAEAGTVLAVQKDLLCVQAGQGIVGIKEIQPAGKKRMSVAAFLRGTPVSPGCRLGIEPGKGRETDE